MPPLSGGRLPDHFRQTEGTLSSNHRTPKAGQSLFLTCKSYRIRTYYTRELWRRYRKPPCKTSSKSFAGRSLRRQYCSSGLRCHALWYANCLPASHPAQTALTIVQGLNERRLPPSRTTGNGFPKGSAWKLDTLGLFSLGSQCISPPWQQLTEPALPPVRGSRIWPKSFALRRWQSSEWPSGFRSKLRPAPGAYPPPL